MSEHDLDPRRGSVLVRRGKGGRRREVGMDAWGWENLQPWLTRRLELPAGPPLCVIDGPTRGRPGQLRQSARSFAGMPPRRASVAASRPTSCATPRRCPVLRARGRSLSVAAVRAPRAPANLIHRRNVLVRVLPGSDREALTGDVEDRHLGGRGCLHLADQLKVL